MRNQPTINNQQQLIPTVSCTYINNTMDSEELKDLSNDLMNIAAKSVMDYINNHEGKRIALTWDVVVDMKDLSAALELFEITHDDYDGSGFDSGYKFIDSVEVSFENIKDFRLPAAKWWKVYKKYSF